MFNFNPFWGIQIDVTASPVWMEFMENNNSLVDKKVDVRNHFWLGIIGNQKSFLVDYNTSFIQAVYFFLSRDFFLFVSFDCFVRRTRLFERHLFRQLLQEYAWYNGHEMTASNHFDRQMNRTCICFSIESGLKGQNIAEQMTNDMAWPREWPLHTPRFKLKARRALRLMNCCATMLNDHTFLRYAFL